MLLLHPQAHALNTTATQGQGEGITGNPDAQAIRSYLTRTVHVLTSKGQKRCSSEAQAMCPVSMGPWADEAQPAVQRNHMKRSLVFRKTNRSIYMTYGWCNSSSNFSSPNPPCWNPCYLRYHSRGAQVRGSLPSARHH